MAELQKMQFKSLAEEFGTPFYFYDGDQFEQSYRTLKACLPESFELFYAVKANPLLGIMQLFRQLGSCAEVASEGELYGALRAGFSPGHIIYTCPGKTYRGLELAVRNGIYCINVESIQEAKLLNTIALQENKTINIAVRINPDFRASEGKIQMSGLSSQFGVEETCLDDFFAYLAANCGQLNCIGIHIYSATQILNVDEILADTKQIIEFALMVSEKYRFELRFIDIGGGFGVSYQHDDPILDMEALRIGYPKIWRQYATRLKGVRVAVESGRYLTADGGEFITQVLSTKLSKGIKYVICDGGYAQHPASAYIAHHKKNRFPIEVNNSSGSEERVTVVGPSGTPIDILGKNVVLPKVNPGDLLRIKKSGAYGYTNSCQLFFSSPSPAEIMRYQGIIYILRSRTHIDDVLLQQRGIFPLNHSSGCRRCG